MDVYSKEDEEEDKEKEKTNERKKRIINKIRRKKDEEEKFVFFQWERIQFGKVETLGAKLTPTTNYHRHHHQLMHNFISL